MLCDLTMASSAMIVRMLPGVALVTMVLQTTSAAGSAPPISADQLEQDLDSFVPEMMRCRKLSGLNVAAVRGTETLVAKAYGYVDMDTKINATEQTLFGIASLSKAFTSALLGKVMALSNKGYTWDTEVRTILGEEFYFYDAQRTVSATLKDLLTHRMGYPSYNSIRHQSGLDRNTLAKKIRFLKPTLPFRTTFKYNNLMYGLLTHITEVIGGDTWENLMKKHVFRPLGMTSADFTHQIDLTRKDLARTYQVDYDGAFREVPPQYHSYWGKIGGSGSIVATVLDMSKWLKMLLNDGTSEDGNEVIPSDVIKDSHATYMTFEPIAADAAYIRPESPVSYTHFSYGLAWRIGFYRGLRMIHHTGTSMGSLAQITLMPDFNIGVVSSLAGDDPGYTCRRHLHLHTLDLLLGETPWINSTSTCDAPQGGKFRSEKTQNTAEIPKGMDLGIYAGTYGNFGFGNISFYTNDSGKLMMSYGDWGIWEMRPNDEPAHSFDAIGTGYVWNWSFWDMVFGYSQEGSTGPMDQITINSMERSNPPVFVRGLRMGEAPAPPNISCALPQIGEVSKAQLLQIPIGMVIMLICITFV